MPNWVYSQLNISGKKADLKKFKEFAHTEKDNWGRKVVLDTNKFIPYPKKYLEMDKLGEELYKLKKKNKVAFSKALVMASLENEKEGHSSYGFNQGGYEWCSKHWNTKWGICNSTIDDLGDEDLHYSFETAWSPCEPVIAKMSKMFPKLDFNYTYEEEGIAFAGQQNYKAGKIVDQEDWTEELQKERKEEDTRTCIVCKNKYLYYDSDSTNEERWCSAKCEKEGLRANG